MPKSYFHVKNGWFFARVSDDGDVEVTKRSAGELSRPVEQQVVFSANEWVSLVSAVAPNRGSGEEHVGAKALHAPSAPTPSQVSRAALERELGELRAKNHDLEQVLEDAAKSYELLQEELKGLGVNEAELRAEIEKLKAGLGYVPTAPAPATVIVSVDSIAPATPELPPVDVAINVEAPPVV